MTNSDQEAKMLTITSAYESQLTRLKELIIQTKE